MNNIEQANRATLTKWYDQVWGKADSSLAASCIGPQYLRHDITGANNLLTAEEYKAIIELGVGHLVVTDFTYLIITEGDYVGTLGRYLLKENVQWDWVQLFRLENARLVETWLPGMGGTEDYCFGKPENAWLGTEVPNQDALPMTPNKVVIKSWYDHLANGTDGRDCLAQHVRTHDIIDADTTVDAPSFYERFHDLMQRDPASDVKLFLMQQEDIVLATGMWTLGDDKRQWNWVQAFRLENEKIVQAWLPAIGGTDASLVHSHDVLWADGVLPSNSTRIKPE